VSRPAARGAGAGPRVLGHGCRHALREAAERAAAVAALPFLEAVVLQSAHPLGLDAPAADAAERERHAAELVLDLLFGAGAAITRPDGAARLRAEPLVLAAFFQNIDLLYLHGFGSADAVSELVMRALEDPT